MINVKNLQKNFEGVEVLKGIDVTINKGDVVCVIGPSGSGKSTFLRCLNLLEKPSDGEIYFNGELITSTYSEEQTFEKAGLYNIYILDIYGNEYIEEYLFERNYPKVTWRYLGSDGKYHTYDPESEELGGFVLTWVSDNQYKISTAVKTRFSFSEGYVYEFINGDPSYTESSGAETVVTIDEGQSFTLKVSYKNHEDCYSIYSGVVDVTPPTVKVTADVDGDGYVSIIDATRIQRYLAKICNIDGSKPYKNEE